MDNLKQNRKESLISQDPSHDSKLNRKKKEKIFLEWSNINYSIINKQKNNKVHAVVDPELQVSENSSNSSDNSDKKIILENIEGFAVPYELLAIMGPSGCGKTTLLNIIAHRQLSYDKSHIITREVLKF